MCIAAITFGPYIIEISLHINMKNILRKNMTYIVEIRNDDIFRRVAQ